MMCCESSKLDEHEVILIVFGVGEETCIFIKRDDMNSGKYKPT